MNDVLEFIKAALPWLAIGYFLATSVVVQKARTEGKEASKLQVLLPSAALFAIAILEFVEGDTNSATTWLVIGGFNLILNGRSRKGGRNSED